MELDWLFTKYPFKYNSALATLENASYIKGQNGYSDYYEDYGWFGGLETMYPYEGYLISLSQEDVLTYPSGNILGNYHINIEQEFYNHDFDLRYPVW